MKKEKYSMLLTECGSGWGPEHYIIYLKGGSYISDEICRLPGGSEVQRKAAKKVLKAMNS